MKIIAIAVLAAVASLPAACSRPDYRAQYEKKCTDAWKDSGYKSRLIYSRTGGTIIGTEYFSCQVQIKGRWIPEENVRLGEDS